MASDAESNDGSWSELEQGFFAAAPPEIPVPPPEPMRFDDLDPIPEARPARPGWERWRAGARRAWTATAPARGAVARSASRATAGARRGLIHATSVTRRKLGPRAAAAGRALSSLVRAVARESRPRLARVVGLLRSVPIDRRTITVAIATVILVTGVSAGVVASRGSGRPATVAAIAPGPAPAVAPAADEPAMTEMTEAPPSLPETAAAQSLAPTPAPPPEARAIRKTPPPSRTRTAVTTRPAAAKKTTAKNPPRARPPSPAPPSSLRSPSPRPPVPLPAPSGPSPRHAGTGSG